MRLERDAAEDLLVSVELVGGGRDAVGWRRERRDARSVERDGVNLRERVSELRGEGATGLSIDVFSLKTARQRFAFDAPDEEEFAAERVAAEEKRLWRWDAVVAGRTHQCELLRARQLLRRAADVALQDQRDVFDAAIAVLDRGVKRPRLARCAAGEAPHVVDAHGARFERALHEGLELRLEVVAHAKNLRRRTKNQEHRTEAGTQRTTTWARTPASISAVTRLDRGTR